MARTIPMKAFLKNLTPALLALALGSGALRAEEPDAVTARVRKELASIIHKDAAKHAVDKPVLELGADDLDVVEWVMNVEEAYHISIPDAKIMDEKVILKKVTIAYVAKLVAEDLERAKRK